MCLHFMPMLVQTFKISIERYFTLFSTLEISFTFDENNSGPHTLTCGTTHAVNYSLDKRLFAKVHCLLLLKFFLTHLVFFPSIQKYSSLYSKISCFTVSNAFVASIYTAILITFLFRASYTSLIKKAVVLVVE